MKTLFWTFVVVIVECGISPARAATVTTLNDDGPGSLRAAITAGGDVDFAVTGTVTLTSGGLVINHATTIHGPGADRLTIARSGAPGIQEFRVLTVNGNTTISGVTIGNGLIGRADEYENGGGILVRGALTLLNCAITENRSVGGWTRGTGVYVNALGRLTAINCLFARNQALGFDSEGSAIYNYGTVALTNCTFSGNSAGYAAAIQNDAFSDGGVMIDSCTIFGNSARFAAGIVNGGGPGSVHTGQLRLRNTIVAGNTGWDWDSDIENRGELTSYGYNLLGFISDLGVAKLQSSDRTNLTAGDLRLAPLANNGGPTLTHALLTNSPAFNSGPTNGFPATDQRGVARPQFNRCDIGAFEANSFGPAPTNHPPVANPQTVTARIGTPLPITLTGSDPDGDPLTYTIATLPAWGTLSGTLPNVVYTPATNSYSSDLFAFKVNDGKADSAPAAVNIAVLPAELPPTNQPPTVNLVSPANGAAFTAPATIFLIASVHDEDGIAAHAAVEFFAGPNKLGNGQLFDPGPPHEAPFRFTWTNVPPGEYTLTAKVTDDHGAVAASAPVHVVVRGAGSNNLSFRLAFNNPNANAGVFFQDYTLNGPVGGGRLLPADRVLAAGGDRYYYGAKPHVMWRVDAQTGAILEMNPGPGLPELSWPMGVAFDSHRARVILTSLGGEGFFYAYSPSSNLWSLLRSQDNRDLDCLEYHPALDAFFGVKVLSGDGGPGTIYRFNAEGAFQGVIALPTLPFGIGPTGYRSELVSLGDYLVLLLEGDPLYNPYGESRIYLIDPRSGSVLLNYQHVTPHPNQPPTVQINSPAPGQSFSSPAEIHLVVYAQDPEDGYNLTVGFFAGTNSLGFGTFVPSLCPSPYCPNFALTWSNVPPGQYTLTARATDSNGAATVSAPVQVTVFDGALSLVTIRATDASASEAGDPGTFTVSRAGNTNQALNVFYSIGGTASNGVDYVALGDSVIIPAGESTTTIQVAPINDAIFEGTERVELRVVQPPIYLMPYVILSPSNAVVNLADNDEPPPPPVVVTLEATDATASETPGNPGQFRVRRTGPTNQSLYVFWTISGSASNGVDYVRLTNVVVIPAGRSAVELPVTPVDDNLFEGPETVVATLYYPPIAGPLPPLYTIGWPSNGVVTISDNDPPVTNLPPIVKIGMPTNEATFTAPANIFICTTPSDGDEYVATVEFFAGDTSLGIKTNTCIPPVCLHILPETFCLMWSNVPSGNYTLTARATDNHGASSVSPPVRISVFPPPPPLPVVTIVATDAHASEPGVLTVIDAGVFTVYRSGRTNDALEVRYAIHGTASNGVDYAAIPGSVTIPAGQTSAKITINPLHDLLPEGTETVVLRLEELLCAAIYPPPPGCYRVGSPPEAVVQIADNDPALPVLTVVTTDSVAAEALNPNGTTNTASFTIRRNGSTNEFLRIVLNVGGTAKYGLDYVTVPPLQDLLHNNYTIVPMPGGVTSAVFTVRALADTLAEGNETAVFALGSNSSYTIGDPGRATLTILDNPPPLGLQITAPPNGANIASTQEVAITVAVTNAGPNTRVQLFADSHLLRTALGPLTGFTTVTNFAPGSHTLYAVGTTADIILPPIPEPFANAVTSAPVHITVYLVNQAPSFTKGRDRFVPKNSGPQSVAHWAEHIKPGPWFEAGQHLSFSLTNDRPALFSAQPAISPAGTLTFTPATNATGTALVAAILKDDGGTANGGHDTSTPQTFRITVLPLNEFPRIATLEDRGTGGKRVCFTGVPGQPYFIQCSTNLVDWQTLGSAIERDSGSFEFLDTDTNGASSSRFYRLSLP